MSRGEVWVRDVGTPAEQTVSSTGAVNSVLLLRDGNVKRTVLDCAAFLAR